MDFNSINLVGAGRTRKAQTGTVKEAGFDVRFSNYSYTSKKGEPITKCDFYWSKKALATLDVNNGKGINIAELPDGSVAVVVVDEAAAPIFGKAKSTAKRGKAQSTTIPSLVSLGTTQGLLVPEFQGSQYLDLKEIEMDVLPEGIHAVYALVPSDVAPKAYTEGDEDNTTGESVEG